MSCILHAISYVYVRCVVLCAQVIEFMANGLAQESFVPRTAQELGLHPRDVTLFAPLSRLAAPQVGWGGGCMQRGIAL
jgi:hypothetical protein